MEYLMTYGWAILIVIIVAAVLFSLGVFNPQTFQQNVATGFSGFNVPAGGFDADGTTGDLQIRLTNGVGAEVTLLTTSSATVGSTTVTGTSVTFSSATVAPGETVTATFAFGTTPPFTTGNGYNADIVIAYDVTGGLSGLASSGRVSGTAS